MARMMSSTELYQRMEEDAEMVVIDILPPERFEQEHIPGAINIPLDALPTKVKEFRKNQRIVVYGEAHHDDGSNKAAEILEKMGFRKVSDFDGGVLAWKRAGFLTQQQKNEESN